MLNRRSLPLGRSLRMLLVGGSTILATAVCASALALHLSLTPASALHVAPGVKVPSSVMAGQLVSTVPPKYPEDAKKARVQGSVVLAAVVSKTGTVEQLRVVSGPPELQASSIDAVKQWVYKPYVLNGQPTEVDTEIEITYSLTQ